MMADILKCIRLKLMIVDHIYCVLNSGEILVRFCFCFVCLFLSIKLRDLPFVLFPDLGMAPLAIAKCLFKMHIHRLGDNTNW